MAGPARSCAKTCCPAASTPAGSLAMLDCVEIARSRSRPGVIAAASRSSSPATNKTSLGGPSVPRKRPGSRARSAASSYVRVFDCGIHTCSQTCHSQDELPSHCPSTPDAVTHCPCGKTSLGQLLEQPRQTCEDGIPHCDRPCEKPLQCGHLCQAKCHTGDHGFCTETIDVSCRCGRTSSESVCHQGNIQHPLH